MDAETRATLTKILENLRARIDVLRDMADSFEGTASEIDFILSKEPDHDDKTEPIPF